MPDTLIKLSFMELDNIKFIHITGISYEKRTAKYCPNEYESYNTLSLAQAACNYDSKCRGVYDGNCDNSTLSLCPLSEELKPSASGSCVYEKIGMVYNMAGLVQQHLMILSSNDILF